MGPSPMLTRNSMSAADITTRTRPKIEVAEPPMFRVIYINDDTTAMEFVIDSLVKWFNYNPDSAAEITLSIHEAGFAVVAVLPYEIAEQKGIEVTVCARSAGYPLQIKLEPDQ